MIYTFLVERTLQLTEINVSLYRNDHIYLDLADYLNSTRRNSDPSCESTSNELAGVRVYTPFGSTMAMVSKHYPLINCSVPIDQFDGSFLVICKNFELVQLADKEQRLIAIVSINAKKQDGNIISCSHAYKQNISNYILFCSFAMNDTIGPAIVHMEADRNLRFKSSIVKNFTEKIRFDLNDGTSMLVSKSRIQNQTLFLFYKMIEFSDSSEPNLPQQANGVYLAGLDENGDWYFVFKDLIQKGSLGRIIGISLNPHYNFKATSEYHFLISSSIDSKVSRNLFYLDQTKPTKILPLATWDIEHSNPIAEFIDRDYSMLLSRSETKVTMMLYATINLYNNENMISFIMKQYFTVEESRSLGPFLYGVSNDNIMVVSFYSKLKEGHRTPGNNYVLLFDKKVLVSSLRSINQESVILPNVETLVEHREGYIIGRNRGTCIVSIDSNFIFTSHNAKYIFQIRYHDGAGGIEIAVVRATIITNFRAYNEFSKKQFRVKLYSGISTNFPLDQMNILGQYSFGEAKSNQQIKITSTSYKVLEGGLIEQGVSSMTTEIRMTNKFLLAIKGNETSVFEFQLFRVLEKIPGIKLEKLSAKPTTFGMIDSVSEFFKVTTSVALILNMYANSRMVLLFHPPKYIGIPYQFYDLLNIEQNIAVKNTDLQYARIFTLEKNSTLSVYKVSVDDNSLKNLTDSIDLGLLSISSMRTHPSFPDHLWLFLNPRIKSQTPQAVLISTINFQIEEIKNLDDRNTNTLIIHSVCSFFNEFFVVKEQEHKIGFKIRDSLVNTLSYPISEYFPNAIRDDLKSTCFSLENMVTLWTTKGINTGLMAVVNAGEYTRADKRFVVYKRTEQLQNGILVGNGIDTLFLSKSGGFGESYDKVYLMKQQPILNYETNFEDNYQDIKYVNVKIPVLQDEYSIGEISYALEFEKALRVPSFSEEKELESLKSFISESNKTVSLQLDKYLLIEGPIYSMNVVTENNGDVDVISSCKTELKTLEFSADLPDYLSKLSLYSDDIIGEDSFLALSYESGITFIKILNNKFENIHAFEVSYYCYTGKHAKQSQDMFVLFLGCKLADGNILLTMVLEQGQSEPIYLDRNTFFSFDTLDVISFYDGKRYLVVVGSSSERKLYVYKFRFYFLKDKGGIIHLKELILSRKDCNCFSNARFL